MPKEEKKESLDAMMADDLDSFTNTLSQMAGQEGYSIFPKSDYQKDGPALTGPTTERVHGRLRHLQSRFLLLSRLCCRFVVVCACVCYSATCHVWAAEDQAIGCNHTVLQSRLGAVPAKKSA